MSDTATFPIPSRNFLELFPKKSRLEEHFNCTEAECQFRTDFTNAEEIRQVTVNAAPKNKWIVLNGMLLSNYIAWGQAAAVNEPSRPTIQSGLLVMSRRQKSPGSADFIEPATFTWTKARHRIRKAAKRYSEQTHADY